MGMYMPGSKTESIIFQVTFFAIVQYWELLGNCSVRPLVLKFWK